MIFFYFTLRSLCPTGTTCRVQKRVITSFGISFFSLLLLFFSLYSISLPFYLSLSSQPSLSMFVFVSVSFCFSFCLYLSIYFLPCFVLYLNTCITSPCLFEQASLIARGDIKRSNFSLSLQLRYVWLFVRRRMCLGRLLCGHGKLDVCYT